MNKRNAFLHHADNQKYLEIGFIKAIKADMLKEEKLLKMLS